MCSHLYFVVLTFFEKLRTERKRVFNNSFPSDDVRNVGVCVGASEPQLLVNKPNQQKQKQNDPSSSIPCPVLFFCSPREQN